METPLLADQRRALIQAEVARTGAVRVAALTETLGVSEMTIRRDIALLADQGLLERVHGGAVAQSAAEPTYAEKAPRAETQKAAIARAVAALIAPGTSLGLTAGSTPAAVARELTALPHLGTVSVLTNSLPAAETLRTAGQRPALTLTGGEPTPSAGLVGPVAEATCRDFHLDLLILGVSGMHPSIGLTSPNSLEVATLRAFLANSRRVIVAADSSKWGTTALRTIAGWDAVDVLVSDGGLPPEAAEQLPGVEIIRV